jgi:hypothetical protein
MSSSIARKKWISSSPSQLGSNFVVLLSNYLCDSCLSLETLPYSSMHASTITMPNFSAYKHKLKKYQRWPHSQVTLHKVQLKNNFHKMEGGNCLGSGTFLLIRFYINYRYYYMNPYNNFFPWVLCWIMLSLMPKFN